MKIVGGKELPGSNLLAAYVSKIVPGSVADTIDDIYEGKPSHRVSKLTPHLHQRHFINAWEKTVLRWVFLVESCRKCRK